MKDPERLLDEGSDASDALRALLRASKATDDPSEAQVSALSSRLAPIIAAPAAGAAGGALAGAGKSLLLAKVGGVVVALACVSGGAAYLYAHRAPPSVAAPPPVVQTAPSQAFVETAEPPPVTATAIVRPEPTPPRNVIDDSEAERKLATSAQQALTSGDDARALALTHDHRARFPKGAHAEERDRIAIEALVRLGRTDEARTAASRFFASYPHSVYRARVETLVR